MGGGQVERRSIRGPAEGGVSQPRGAFFAGSLVLFFTGSTLLGANLLLMGVAFLLHSDLSRIQKEKESRLVTVVVMTRDLGAGTVIKPGDFDLRRMETQFVPLEACHSPDQVLGRTVTEQVFAGDVARVERLAPSNAGYGLNALIPNGMRAVSLDLRDGEQVSGWVEPGDHVDLLVTLPSSNHAPAETVTLLQGTRVLAVKERISTTAMGREIRTPQVTLLVPALQADAVIHALHLGKPKLVLRGEIDFQVLSYNVADAPWLGDRRTRLAANEFSSRYTEDDVARWVDIISGNHVVREPVIDPTILRDIPRVP